VDIGYGVGALILYADAEREGLEVEIYPVGDSSLRQHVWVLPRSVASGTVFAAVFPSLPEGRYAVCDEKGGAPGKDVEVRGGTVTEDRWE
jgi:hypothetical protein